MRKPELHEQIHTLAWYNAVKARAGAKNPQQLLKRFGWGGSWNVYSKATSKPGQEWLNAAEREFPGTRSVYEDGPDGLWLAISPDETNLWRTCELYSVQRWGLTRWSIRLPAKPLVDRSLPLDVSINNFERWLLRRYAARRESIGLRELRIAIRLYRLHGKAGHVSDDVPQHTTYDLIKLCLRAPTVVQELNGLGVLEKFNELVESWERARIDRDFEFRNMVEVLGRLGLRLADPVSAYIRDPLRFSARVSGGARKGGRSAFGRLLRAVAPVVLKVEGRRELKREETRGAEYSLLGGPPAA